MKKAYWLAPVAVLILFIGLYMHSRKEIEQKAIDIKQKADNERRVKIEEQERRQKEAAAKRKADKEIKDKKEAEERERRAAEAAYFDDIEIKRDFAKREVVRFQNVVKELTDALKMEKDAKAKAEKDIEDMRKEKEFLLSYVSKAEGNQKILRDLMLKLEQLETERAKALADAAKAAAKT